MLNMTLHSVVLSYSIALPPHCFTVCAVLCRNTRITDPEILERRYPVLLQHFSLRDGSGGRGLHAGGDGVIREVRFLRTLSVGILSERRAFRPYGMAGGEDGAVGINLLLRADGRTLNLGGKNAFVAKRGDVIRICTPGGGGYGEPRNDGDAAEDDASGRSKTLARAEPHEHVLRGSHAEYTSLQEQA